MDNSWGISEIREHFEKRGIHLSPASIYKLMDSGLLGEQTVENTYRNDRMIKVVKQSRVELLANSPLVSQSDGPDALVVRANVPLMERTDKEIAKDLDKRRWIGWKSSWDLKTRIDGVREWHQVKDHESWVGHILVATVSGFVAETFRITDYQTHASIVSYELKKVATPEVDEAHYFIGHRFKDSGAGKTVYPHYGSEAWFNSHLAAKSERSRQRKQEKLEKQASKRERRNEWRREDYHKKKNQVKGGKKG